MAIPNPQPCPHCDVTATGEHLHQCPDAPRYIIWDPKDGVPTRDDSGNITTSGLLGRLTAGNVYLRSYAALPDGRQVADLAVGDVIRGAKFHLSRERGTYDIWRVQ